MSSASDDDVPIPDPEVDYTKYDEDSVPPEEKHPPPEHEHPGRPDLDDDDTVVGPAEGVEYKKD